MNRDPAARPQAPQTQTAMLPHLASTTRGKAGPVPCSVLLLFVLQVGSKSTP